MYRLILESLLGLRLEADKLHITPRLPADWKAFTIHYRYRETIYHISVLQTMGGTGQTSVTVDGVESRGPGIHLVDDHREHFVALRTNVRQKDLLNLSEIQGLDFGSG
jgi:cellobiose phosphorylase